MHRANLLRPACFDDLCDVLDPRKSASRPRVTALRWLRAYANNSCSFEGLYA